MTGQQTLAFKSQKLVSGKLEVDSTETSTWRHINYTLGRDVKSLSYDCSVEAVHLR